MPSAVDACLRNFLSTGVNPRLLSSKAFLKPLNKIRYKRAFKALQPLISSYLPQVNY